MDILRLFLASWNAGKLSAHALAVSWRKVVNLWGFARSQHRGVLAWT